MAVHTHLSEFEIVKILEDYELGTLVNFKGIKRVLKIQTI